MLRFNIAYTKFDAILSFSVQAFTNFDFVSEADLTLFAKLMLEITICTILKMSDSDSIKNENELQHARKWTNRIFTLVLAKEVIPRQKASLICIKFL